MASQITIALCEGPHDVAFIQRTLRYGGFESRDSVKIGALPVPMNGILKQEIVKTDIDGLNLQQASRGVLPTCILKKEEHHLFLYAMGGDGKRKQREDLLKKIKLTIPDEGEIDQGLLPADTQLSVLYFFDADGQGVSYRLQQVRAEIEKVVAAVKEEHFQHNYEVQQYGRLRIGVGVFVGEDGDTGKLEDILLPMMRDGNDDIFTQAEAYLDVHYREERTARNKIRKTPTGEVIDQPDAGDKDYNREKSLIGIAGQLQRSGKANTVYITDTDYLSSEKMRNSKAFEQIVRFFEQ